MNRLHFFASKLGGRSVIDQFIRGDLKKLRDVQLQLIDQLKVLEATPIETLRKTERIKHLEPDLFEFRFSTKDHWVRLLLTFWPEANDIVILLPLLKKRNRLDNDDIAQAKINLRKLREKL